MQIVSTRVLYVIWNASNYVTADAISSHDQHKTPHWQLWAVMSNNFYRPVRLCCNMITEQEALLEQIKLNGSLIRQVKCQVNFNSIYSMVCKTVTNCEFVVVESMSLLRLFPHIFFRHQRKTPDYCSSRHGRNAGPSNGGRTCVTSTGCNQSVSCDLFWVRSWNSWLQPYTFLAVGTVTSGLK
jgi:hypothetical protein